MDALLGALKAAGEPTRLRILVILDRNELTVGELCRVLGQSQPRVSRHLKLLVEAGLLERHTEGASAFFRAALDGPLSALYDTVMEMVDADDTVRASDRLRLDEVRAERAELAASYFETLAPDWERIRAAHVSDATVEAAMLDAIGPNPIGTLLDVGTGTGRILEIAAPRIDRGLGIDLSREMLHLARTRLESAGLGHCVVRHGDIYDLDVPSDTVDVAVMHHVLHFLDRPAEAIAEVARTLTRRGRLVVVDFARHQVERLRSDYAHHRLGFADDEVNTFCRDAGLHVESAAHFSPRLAGGSALVATEEDIEPLTVTIWTAQNQALARAGVPDLETAS